jgi:hypothetical protein
MINNSTNINKTKQSLHSDDQQFHQYQQNKRKFTHWWSTNPPISVVFIDWNIICAVFYSLFIHVLLFEIRVSNEVDWYPMCACPKARTRFPKSYIVLPPISTKQNKVYTVMINNSTNINKTKESLHSDDQQFHQYQQNKTKFTQWWSTIPPISTKQKKVYTVMINNSICVIVCGFYWLEYNLCSFLLFVYTCIALRNPGIKWGGLVSHVCLS